MPATSSQPHSLESSRQKQRPAGAGRGPLPRKDLLIIECDAANLVADRLHLGTAYDYLLAHPLLSPILPHKTVTLVKTSTASRLSEQFAGAFDEHGRSKAILIVGHSNDEGLQLASDLFCDWRMVGKWLRPFEPQFVVLAACEAGKSKAIRQLFEPLKTLRDIYASPVKLYAPQAAALAVLIGMRLWYEELGDTHSRALRIVNYVGTGGQLYHWKRKETGAGQEIPPEFWDSLSGVFDRGQWDLGQMVTDFIERRRNS